MDEQIGSSGFSFNKKNILGICGIVLLLAAIPAAVYLVQQKQIFKPKASTLKPVSGPETSFTLNINGPESIKPGDQFRVSLLVRSDIDAANLFAAKLNFPADKLKVTAINTSSASAVQGVNIAATGVCAQVITRACDSANSTICKIFSTPCDVPAGWITQPGIRIPEPTSTLVVPSHTSSEPVNTDYFVKNWVENTFDNVAGTISLVGGLPSPGFQTRLGESSKIMVEILFTALDKEGNATISFTDDSAIYRNSDNQNILNIKRDLGISLSKAVPSSTPGASPSASLTPTPTSRGIKGDVNGDGKITLVDMSALLSKLGQPNGGAADINGDGVVNTMDYSLMVKILTDAGIIKSASSLPPMQSPTR